MDSAFTLRAFVPAHLPELTELWVASWQTAMPQIDFEVRRVWFVDHLGALQGRGVEIVCAFDAASLAADSANAYVHSASEYLLRLIQPLVKGCAAKILQCKVCSCR